MENNYDKESYINFNGWNVLSGLVTSIDWESMIVFIQSHFKTSGKKTLCVPPSPSEIYLFQTPLPLGISMDIFWSYTL